MYRHEIDEKTQTLKLWVRRKRGNKVLLCSGCGGRCSKIEEIRQREVRDLPWRKYSDHRGGGVLPRALPEDRVGAVPQLPSKAPFSKDFEDAVGLACESPGSAAASRTRSRS